MSICRSCGAPLIWAITRSGKKLPLDPEPDPVRGRVWLDGNVAHFPRKHDRDAALKRNEPLFIPHWATCDSPDKFRKGRT